MQAAVASGYGSVECIEVCLAESVPVPRETEVLIRVAFASVNPVDWKMLCGYLAIIESGGPMKRRIRGFDACGEVISAGEKCARLRPGDKVMCMLHFSQVSAGQGTFAEFVAVEEK
jgi:NADPH:quinone reductase-like Zn-dependent oxidoreductase